MPPATKGTVPARIYEEQVRLLYRHAPGGLVAGIFAATVAWILLLPKTAFSPLASWYLAYCLVTLARLVLVRVYERHGASGGRPGLWASLFNVGTVAGSTVAGLCGTWLLPGHLIAFPDVAVLAMGAIAAGSGASYASFRLTAVAFLVPLVMPFAAAMLARGAEPQVYVGVAALVYLVALIAIAWRNQRDLAESLRLRFKNDELEKSLSTTKAQTVATTRELASQIAERERAEAAVREHRQRLDLMIQQTPVGCIEWNRDFVVTGWNPAAEGIFGYSPSEAIGRDGLALLIPPELQPVVRNQIAEFLGGTGRKHGLIRSVTRDGRAVLCEWYNTPVKDATGQVTDVVSLVLDVTERSKLDRMKNEFIHVVSHELRTPLTSIQGAVGLLSGGVAGDLSQQAHSLVEIASSNTDRLLRLVDDLLDMERLQAGKVRYREEVVDLSMLVAEVVESGRKVAAAMAVTIEFTPDPGPAWLRGDPVRIRQAVGNVVENAVKFSPHGGVVRIAIQARDPGVIRVAVVDTGPGIPPEFRDRIYEKFTQADASNARPREGSGLGLAIAKHIVEAHRGRLSFDSEVNSGTSFYLDFPRDPVARQVHA